MNSEFQLPIIIAVDFDGTIVEHTYPSIGREQLFAFETLKALQSKGYKLILWTFRAGKELDEAVEYCRRRGVEFYAVNKNNPDEIFEEGTISRKINADIYIDDRNLGGFPGWSTTYQMITGENRKLEKNKPDHIKKTFFEKLSDLFK